MRRGAVCTPDAQKRTVWADAGIVQPLLEPLPAKVILAPAAIGTAANASDQRTSAYAAAVRVRMPKPA